MARSSLPCRTQLKRHSAEHSGFVRPRQHVVGGVCNPDTASSTVSISTSKKSARFLGVGKALRISARRDPRNSINAPYPLFSNWCVSFLWRRFALSIPTLLRADTLMIRLSSITSSGVKWVPASGSSRYSRMKVPFTFHKRRKASTSQIPCLQ